MVRPLLALVLFPLLAVAAPVPKPAKKERPNLDGTWQMVERNADGRASAGGDLKWVVKGEELLHQRGDKAPGADVRATLALVAPEGGEVNHLDHVVTHPGGETQTLRGVFELDGDTLRFCGGRKGDRPTDCKPGADRILYTLKRVPDPKK